MNKQLQKKIKKVSLARETIRHLDQHELSSAAAGITSGPGCNTHFCSEPLTCTDVYC